MLTRKSALLLAGTAFAVGGLVGAGVASTFKPGGDNGSTSAATTTTTAPYYSSAPTTASSAPLPTPDQFFIQVIVTSKNCFGSAGCNYEYTINPQYFSLNPLPKKSTVIYTVTGGDQDQVGSFTIDQNGTATFQRENTLQGPDGAQLEAKATQVLPY